jgi:ribonuclease J
MRTLAFAQAARAAGARLLILEGTRLAPPPELEATGPAVIAYERVEADVAPDTVRALREIPGKLGVILLTPENGERIEALAGAVSEAGRLLVLDLEGLTFATAALGRPIAAPHAVYVPSDTALALESGREIAPSLSEALSAAPQVMSACEMAADPGAFLLRLGFERFADLVDLLPAVQGGIVISSNGPPLGPFDPAWAHMEWWAAHLGMSVIDVNCTGHASPRDLALIAAQSGAPTVMSIHSRHPELLPVAPERLLLPERGRPYRLSELGR